MRIEKTTQGNYKLYLWDIGRDVPRGLEGSAITLNREELIMLRDMIRTYNF